MRQAQKVSAFSLTNTADFPYEGRVQSCCSTSPLGRRVKGCKSAQQLVPIIASSKRTNHRVFAVFRSVWTVTDLAPPSFDSFTRPGLSSPVLRMQTTLLSLLTNDRDKEDPRSGERVAVSMNNSPPRPVFHTTELCRLACVGGSQASIPQTTP